MAMMNGRVGLVRLDALFFGALVAALLTVGVGDTNAQQCITKQAKDNLANCPGGKFKTNINQKRQVSFTTAPQGRKKKARATSLKPVNPTEISNSAIRDEREARLKPKVRKLLLTEIGGVERLYKNTPRRDKDRPRLMRRLAEGYVELEASAFRDKVSAEIKAQDLRKKNPKLAARYKKSAKRAKAVIKTARKSAIKYYRRLKRQYPKWCQFRKNPVGKRGCIDEVLYYLAYEYEQAGNLDKAREVYLELTEHWKKSRFIPNAYLAFGELFFNEAQGDPSKWAYAGNFYREVLKYPAPENKLYGYAAYKLGYVEWNQGNYDKAIDQFKTVIQFGQKYPQLPNAKGLAKSARRDIIPVYALKGDPRRAYSFFKPLSGDKGVSSENTYAMMEDLGQNLLDTGHYPEAIILYKDLMKRNRGENHCFYQARITEAVMASKSGNKAPIVAELKNQLKVYQDFQKSRQNAKAKLKCANESAGLITETAMAWHLEAVGSGGVRGTGDKNTMKYSAQLYQLVVDNFTQAQFNQFRFPRIVKEDWPSIPKVRYAMADLLYFQKDWEKCGPAFDAVVAEDPNGPNAAEAAFASVLCYQNIYAKQHADGSHRASSGNLPEGSSSAKKGSKSDAAKFKAKPFSSQQKGMITAFNRYVCYIKPPKGKNEALEQYVEVKYARARTYFEAQHWEEAAWAFRDIAINHPNLDAAVYAAQLYLESLNILGSKVDPTRPDCYKMMEKDVPTFISSFCTEKKREENEDQCNVLFRVQRDIERLRAENLVKACDEGKSTGCIKKYEEAAELYLGLWNKYGKEPCEKWGADKKDEAAKAGCARNDEILYNAARAFQASRLIAKAIAVRGKLIDPKYGLNDTELGKKAVYEIGGNYQAIADYGEAARWYERFATNYPKMEKAPDALSDAVVLRLGLGQSDKGISDANLFRRKYGARKPEQAAQIAFAVGAHYAGREDWRNAERTLNSAMRQIDSKATIDVRLQAHALLGRVYDKQKRTAQSDRQYARVRDSWRDPAGMIKKIESIGGSKSEQTRRLVKVLNAVGEAYFYFAEKKRAAVDKIEFPEYKGSGDRADVDKFVKGKVKTWMDKKRAAIKAADTEYLKVIKLKPEPPPKWVIKSGAAVGNMWGRFVADFRTAPYPKEWNRDGFVPGLEPPLLWAELKATYLARLDAASEREKRAARGAYDTCLRYSVKFQFFDEDSRSCEEWLSKNYPNDYHLIDEFRGAPDRVNSGLDERPQPLNIGGQPYVEDTRAQEEKAEKGDKKKGKK